MKSKVSYIFIKTMTLFILIFLVVSMFYIKNLKDIYVEEMNNSIKSDLNNKTEIIKNSLFDSKQKIITVVKSYEENKDLKILQKDLDYLLRFEKEYLSIKFFDLNIDEVIDSKYYNDIKNLKNGEIFLTSITLKRDKKHFATPHIPTVYFITPLYNNDNKKTAYLFFEYNMQTIFKKLESNKIKTLFLNKEDYILNSKNQDENFGFLFGKKSTYENIKNQDNQRVFIEEIEPIKFLNSEFKTNFETTWKIVNIANYSVLKDKTAKYLSSITWIVFLYFLVATFISYIFAEYKHNEKEHKLRLKISNNVFENSHDGIIITNHENKIIQVNKAFTKITGYKEKEILNKTPRILKSSGVHTKQFYKNIWDSLNNNGNWEGEITNEKKDGTTYTEELSISKITTEENNTFYIASFVDITENKKNRKIIEDKLEENKTYLEIINDYLISLKVDINGKILDVSDAFCKICEYSKEELIGNSHDVFRDPTATKEFYINIWNQIYSGKTWEGELKNIKKSGEMYYVNAKISPIYSNNTIIGYASIAVDITDKKRVEEISITDELTQTYNRRFFNITIDKEILRAKRDGKTLGFAILDIDYFKQYNDTYGHNKGDRALQEVANIIKATINRASDYLFRLGGEEFGILVTDIDEKNFKNLLERVKTNIEDLHINHSQNQASSYLSASFGGVIFNPSISDKKMYKSADKLLYKAKEEGRNKVLVETI